MNSSSISNKNRNSRLPCVISGIRRNVFNFTPFSITVALGLSFEAFIMLWYDPPISGSSGVLSSRHEGMFNFVKYLFCICWNDLVVFFVLDSIYLLYCVFVCVETYLHPWNEINLVTVCGLFNLVCRYFTEDLCIYVH
jgi:hypothetical protein